MGAPVGGFIFTPQREVLRLFPRDFPLPDVTTIDCMLTLAEVQETMKKGESPGRKEYVSCIRGKDGASLSYVGFVAPDKILYLHSASKDMTRERFGKIAGKLGSLYGV